MNSSYVLKFGLLVTLRFFDAMSRCFYVSQTVFLKCTMYDWIFRCFDYSVISATHLDVSTNNFKSSGYLQFLDLWIHYARWYWWIPIDFKWRSMLQYYFSYQTLNEYKFLMSTCWRYFALMFDKWHCCYCDVSMFAQSVLWGLSYKSRTFRWISIIDICNCVAIWSLDDYLVLIWGVLPRRMLPVMGKCCCGKTTLLGGVRVRAGHCCS